MRYRDLTILTGRGHAGIRVLAVCQTADTAATSDVGVRRQDDERCEMRACESEAVLVDYRPGIVGVSVE